MKFIKLSFIALVLFSLNGCTINATEPTTPKIVYVTTPLPIPKKPQLPKVSSSDLECVPEDTKQKLLQRDILIKNYVSDLETAVFSTHSEGK